MSIAFHLIDQAYLLARRGRRPRSTDLKRAVSSAYYALFHQLAEACANALVGRKQRQTDAWTRAYRALEHGKSKQEFRRIVANSSPGALYQIASEFIELQDLRHMADYDPRPLNLSRIGTLALVKRAEAVVRTIPGVPEDQMMQLATVLLLRDRTR